MLFARRVASIFSSCEVPSVALRAEASMVFVFRVINDDLLDLKLLPYLLGFRVGIAAKGVAAHSVLWSRAKLLLSQQPVQDLAGDHNIKKLRPSRRSKTM